MGVLLDLRFTHGAVVTAVWLYHLTTITEPDSWRHGDKGDQLPAFTSDHMFP